MKAAEFKDAFAADRADVADASRPRLHGLAKRNRSWMIAAMSAAALGGTAAWVAQRARQAERGDPPKGRFVTVDDVRLHYVDHGEGPVVVLLHGNVLRLEDFIASGLIERLGDDHRVIAFDRPGYGYSERPRDRLWTADKQASVLERALTQLGVEAPTVLGHSWGTLVALALAARGVASVRKLVLVSGYYYPTARMDALLASPPAIPIVGDVMRYTVNALFARMMLGRTFKAMFAPNPVPASFNQVLDRELLLRPSQLKANAEDAAYLIPSAAALRKRYATLTTPTVILAGNDDKAVDPDAHSRRLHGELRNSELHVVPGVGHMLHHAAVDTVINAVAAPEIPTLRQAVSPTLLRASQR